MSARKKTVRPYAKRRAPREDSRTRTRYTSMGAVAEPLSMATGYRAVSEASREKRTATGGAGWLHYRWHREQLIHQSREFMRNNGIYRGMIERSAAYIVADGFNLTPKTRNAGMNETIEKLWREWWKRPEIRGILSGPRLERMVCRELLTCGDNGLIRTKRGKLQQFESEQLSSSRLPDGISVDPYGTPVAFWVSPYMAGGQVQKAKAKEYKPSEVIYIAEPDRPSSLRGVPPAQAAFPMLHRINDVCDSEAVAWQMLARLAFSVTRRGGPAIARQESKEDEDAEDGDLTDRLHELDYALIFHAEPGEEVKGIERNVPGQNFSESLVMFLRLMGLPLGLPLEIILLDWTKSNYSQSRAVLEQTFKTFTGWQDLLEDFFYRPAYEWFIELMQAAGSLPQNRDDLKLHDWVKPTFPWIDQLKEAQAYGLKLDRSFALHAEVLKSLGKDPVEHLQAREKEVIEAIERAQGIEAKTGTQVPWQIFCGLRPDGQSERAGIPRGEDTGAADTSGGQE